MVSLTDDLSVHEAHRSTDHFLLWSQTLFKDGQLMRMIKQLLLGCLMLFCFVSAAEAQAQDWSGRGYFHISFGGQPGDQSFTESSTFTYNIERGDVATGYSVGGGTLFDIAGGARVWRSFGIGLAYSRVSNTNDAVTRIRVPHPVVFGQPREASATTEVEHSEDVVHLQFLWMLPYRDKFQFAFMIGPSFFNVKQEFATVQVPQDIQDVPPYTSVTITNVTVSEAKDSPVGVNVGVDATYLIRPMFGVGLFMRYAGGSLELPIPAGGSRDEDLSSGGFQAGGGLRVRF
jgi:hypothetical protein